MVNKFVNGLTAVSLGVGTECIFVSWQIQNSWRTGNPCAVMLLCKISLALPLNSIMMHYANIWSLTCGLPGRWLNSSLHPTNTTSQYRPITEISETSTQLTHRNMPLWSTSHSLHRWDSPNGDFYPVRLPVLPFEQVRCDASSLTKSLSSLLCWSLVTWSPLLNITAFKRIWTP